MTWFAKVYYYLSFTLPSVFFFVLASVMIIHNKLNELIAAIALGVILAFILRYLAKIAVKKSPKLRVFSREILWLVISILTLASGLSEYSRYSLSDPITLAAPSSLLCASFLLLLVSNDSLRNIRLWDRFGPNRGDLEKALAKLETISVAEDFKEIRLAYRSTEILPFLLSTGQLNLTMVIISNIIEKLIAEGFKVLNIPIPRDERGNQCGWVRKADFLDLNLQIEEKFSFKDFYHLRGKYVHGPIDKKVEIVPPLEHITRSIKLLSKTLREYPAIIDSMRKEVAAKRLS